MDDKKKLDRCKSDFRIALVSISKKKREKEGVARRDA